MRSNRQTKATIACLACVCILAGVASVMADGPARTMNAAVMDRDGNLMPQTRLSASSEGVEAVRAEPMGAGTWRLSGVGEKVTLHLKDPVHGNESIELTMPAQGQVQVNVYWNGKTAEARMFTLPEPTPKGMRATPDTSPSPIIGGLRADCPPDSLYGQASHTPADGWSAGTSEVDATGSNYLRAESFVGVSGDVCDLHWWGLTAYNDGFGWLACTDSDPSFEVKFYADAGGAPGAETCTYIVTPTITDTGESFSGFPLHYFSVDNLTPCCAVNDGWVSIQGLGDATCWFLWISSPDGDGSSYFNNNGTPEAYAFDNAFCLTGQYVPVYGACCDDSTGTCLDDVEQQDCTGRFAADTLCADLDPACGSITTCEHSVVLTDDYGDGWNGAQLDVAVNGNVLLKDITLASGSGPQTFYFQAATGDVISTVFSPPGSYPTECEYHIYDVNGNQICADGVGGTTPTGGSCGTGFCDADPCAGSEPANDECVNADAVTGPYPATYSGTNECATVDCPGVLDWVATWVSIDLPYAVNELDISFCGNGFEINNVGVVYYNACGDCPNYVLYTGLEWYLCPDGITSPIINWKDIAGPTTVYFPVYFNDGEEVPYTIEVNVSEIVPPPNDLCADAIPVAVPSLTPGYTDAATIDDTFGTCGTSITSPGVWYSVIGTGNTMTASLCNGATTWDSKISVYCTGCDEPTCVDGNDDFCGLQSEISWCSQLGAEYLILVHGFGGATGTFELDVYDDGVGCAADVACLPEGACCLPSGECVIINENACNALGGGYQGDDTNCLGLPVPDATITIELLTDTYGSETSWTLADEDGNIVGEGSGLLGDTLYSFDFPVLSCGCYTFTIFDSYGDGICCAYGDGYYNVLYNGALVATGGEFADLETVSDIGDCTGCMASVGACCVPDGTCVITTEDCCLYAGGTYVGDGTNCGTGTVEFFSENFDGGIPADWIITDDSASGLVWTTNDVIGDDNWTGGTGLAAEASSDNFGTAQYDTSLITPNLDMSGVVSATLEFDANYQNFANYDFFEVYVSYDKGVTWNLLLSWNEDHGTFHGVGGEHVVLPIAGGSMDTQIRFRYYDPAANYNWEVQVDNVVINAEVEGFSPCRHMNILSWFCPAKFYPQRPWGIMPVAMPGYDDLDVHDIDLDSLVLTRVDGVGGEAPLADGLWGGHGHGGGGHGGGHHRCPDHPWIWYWDITAPYTGDGLCSCAWLWPDGVDDLVMFFDKHQMKCILELLDVPDDTIVPLALRGTLLDGSPFIATDCIEVEQGCHHGGHGGHHMGVRSNTLGAYVNVEPYDLDGAGGGICDFDRYYDSGEVVTLTAPDTADGVTFVGWRSGGAWISRESTVQVTVTEGMPEVRAMYIRDESPVSPIMGQKTRIRPAP